jgi:hypothetical protein
MNSICAAEPCPVILNSACVFYRGANLVYTGILTNDNFQTVLEKIDNKFKNAAIGYIFNNGVVQTTSGGPVQLGGSLIQNTTITSSGFDLTITGDVNAGKFATIGGTSSQFVKGDGSLDSTSYQTAGNYITSLTGDGTASGPGSAVFTLSPISAIYAGTWGSSTQIPQFTLDSKGRITSVSNVAMSIPPASLSFTGDVFGSGLTGSPVTLTINNTNPNIYGTITPLKFSVNNRGLITGASPITNLDLDGIYGYTPVPSTRTLTINGQTYDLSANRSWTIATGGSVSSVSVTPGAGISASVTNPTTTPNITITNTAPDQTVVLNSGTGISTSGTYPNFTITNTSPDQTVSLGTTGSGLSVTGTYPSFTLQNTLPDQTVAISAGTGISITGTYPNFTITNSSPSSGGTVTSVAALTLGTTGTDLNSSVASGTTTPVITLNVPTASATNRGALSSTDWSTFNGKQDVLTNPITGTGTNNEIAYFNTTGSTIASLSTATYPSLTELSYVKGATSSLQTQLNAKFPTSSYEWIFASGLQALGSTIKGINLGTPVLYSLGAAAVLTNGAVRFVPYYLVNPATITGVKFYQANTANYVGNNYNGVGLYSYSGGTLTLVASTTNAASFWINTINTWVTKAFSSPYSAPAGVYYIGMMYSFSSQTTAPQTIAGSTANVGFATMDLTNSAKISAVSATGQTVLPSSIAMSSINSAVNVPLIYLY